MTLYDWAQRHGIPFAAIKELEQLMGIEETPLAERTDLSEAAVQTNLRLEASRLGIRLFRNNVGAGKIETDDGDSTFVRWGLANESEKMNRAIKSGDLIGIRPLVVTPEMVGHTIGQFVSREAKPGRWRYSATEHEKAQLAWIMLVLSLGGDAAFANGEGTL